MTANLDLMTTQLSPILPLTRTASRTSAISFEPIFKACDFLFGARVAFWLVSDNAFFQIAFNIIMPDKNYAIFK